MVMVQAVVVMVQVVVERGYNDEDDVEDEDESVVDGRSATTTSLLHE